MKKNPLLAREFIEGLVTNKNPITRIGNYINILFIFIIFQRHFNVS